MKVELYEMMARKALSRRGLMKGAAGAGATALLGPALMGMSTSAFAQGNLDWVCGWGGSLRRNLEHGNVLLTGAEKEAAGIRVFDVISTTGTFAA